MNWNVASDLYSHQIAGFVYEGLIGTNPVDGTLAPGIADTWEVADDGITYTFKLNPNVKFHDGTPLTSADVVFTFDSILAEDSLAYYRETIMSQLDSYRAIDDHTVEFVASGIYSTFLFNTVYLAVIVPKHIWENVPPADWGADPGSTGQDPTRVIGTGPFKFVEWVPEDHVTLEKNADYWDTSLPPVTIDTLTYRVIVEPTAMLQAVETGEVDFSEIDAAQAPSVEQNQDLQLVAFDTFGVNWYAANQDPSKTELFTDVKVRQALMYALDRKLIAEEVYYGYAIQADGTQPVMSVAYRPDEINTIYNYDPDMANQLLDEAGWALGDDGVRAKDGVRLSFECLYSEGVATYEVQIPAMQQMWAEVGIEMLPTVVPFTALLDAVDTGDYAMAVFGFTWGVDGGQLPMFGCDYLPPNGSNSMRYCNPEYDELSVQAETILPWNGEERVDLLVEASNIVNDDQAAGYLVFRQELMLGNQTLHNFVPNAYGGNVWWLTWAWTEVQN
jgi:peptide/nickel transport system substrate-binding protein